MKSIIAFYILGLLAGGVFLKRISIFRQVSKCWRTLFPRTIRQFEQTYCSICDGRIWFWQSAERIYELGMTRAHNDCAAAYNRSRLAEDNKARLRAAGALLTEIRLGLKQNSEGGKHEKHYTN